MSTTLNTFEKSGNEDQVDRRREKTFNIIARHSNQCMDVWRASRTRGAKVIQWHCHRGYNQKFSLIRTRAGSFYIRNANSRQVLDIHGGSRKNGGRLIQWPLHGHNNQQFWFRAYGSHFYRIVARHSGKCLDVHSGSRRHGATIIQWPCHRGHNQQWYLVNATHFVDHRLRSNSRNVVNWYRYWNARISDHFYTTNIREIGTARRGRVGRHGYRSEGVAGRCLRRRVRGSIPLYRYWNPRIHDHFYTANWNELKRGRHGWRYEGVTCYCFPNASRHLAVGLRPMYRYWNPHNNDHFYTKNIREIGTARPGRVGRYGYKSEGTVCWMW